MYYIFFSTLHVTGKYKGLFSREYRKFNSALYINILLWVRWLFGTAGWAEPCTGFHGRGGQKGTIHHVQLHVVRKLFLLAARRKYIMSDMCTVTKAALQKPKRNWGGKNDVKNKMLLRSVMINIFTWEKRTNKNPCMKRKLLLDTYSVTVVSPH